MMYLIEKLSTALRGSTREVLESAVDKQSLRIYAQEIYESESSLRESKQHLSQVMAEKLQLKRQISQRSTQLEAKKDAILARLAQDDEAGALQLASELTEQQDGLDKQQQHYAKLLTYEQNLLQALKSTANQLEQHRAALRMAQATQHTQQAISKLAQPQHLRSDSLTRLQDSLQRIERQQTGVADQLQALEQIEAYISGEPDAKQQNRQKAEALLAGLKERSR